MTDPHEALRAAVARLEEVERALGDGEAADGLLGDLAEEATRLAGEVSALIAESLRGADDRDPR